MFGAFVFAGAPFAGVASGPSQPTQIGKSVLMRVYANAGVGTNDDSRIYIASKPNTVINSEPTTTVAHPESRSITLNDDLSLGVLSSREKETLLVSLSNT